MPFATLTSCLQKVQCLQNHLHSYLLQKLGLNGSDIVVNTIQIFGIKWIMAHWVPPYSTEKLNIVKYVNMLLMVMSGLSLTHNATISQKISSPSCTFTNQNCDMHIIGCMSFWHTSLQLALNANELTTPRSKQYSKT